MNCPSRVDPEAIPNGWNQNPNQFAEDSNREHNGIANLIGQRGHVIPQLRKAEDDPDDAPLAEPRKESIQTEKQGGTVQEIAVPKEAAVEMAARSTSLALSTTSTSGDAGESRGGGGPGRGCLSGCSAALKRVWASLVKFSRFIGPGFMVAVAYIDPGNYATDVAAGATYRFRLLVMILVSNLIAIFLQSLCIRLGSVTGMNLAENIKAHCPSWLNYVLYFFAECAIIATDIAEVIGTAIALNLLFHIPLVAGCAISIVDVLVILIFYRPHGSMKGLRFFEIFVIALVLGVVISFIVELSLITVPDVGQIFKGYLPSHVLVEAQGLYQACGILGATVMPHSLYLGSGIVQPRLREFDQKNGSLAAPSTDSIGTTRDSDMPKYKPSLAAIRYCLKNSIIELALSLFTFALFVNSAILIVAGASLADTPGADDADLFSIHDLLSKSLAPAAGTVFALALLLSGLSAGVVCTIAGQMVSEGQLSLAMKPWVRRLFTRSISITPSIIIAGAVGREGLSKALEGSQVALSVILPFVSAPLIYFTCRSSIMTVECSELPEGRVKMRNNYITAAFGVLLWLLICIMNVALLVLVGLGKS